MYPTNSSTVHASEESVNTEAPLEPSCDTGAVVTTAGVASAANIGDLVFIQSDTDSPITFVGDSGVTVNSAYSLELYDRYSSCALLVTAVNTWTAFGDLKI